MSLVQIELLQVLKVLAGFPVHFHAGMIGDLRADGATNLNEEAALEQVEADAWKARLMSLEAYLKKDLALLARASQGYEILQNQLLAQLISVLC